MGGAPNRPSASTSHPCRLSTSPRAAARHTKCDIALDGGRLECAYHGLCYDTNGQCIAIPSQPDNAIPSQARLSVVPVKEQHGLVWIWPGNPAAAQRVASPRTPEILDPANLSIGSPGPLHVPANYLLLIENLLDITHSYPLHDGNIGDKENSKIPVELEEGETEDIRM